MTTATANPANPISTRMLLFFCSHRVPLLSKLFRMLFNSDIYCDVSRRDILMPHPYGIIIHSKAHIGRRVVIMQQVTIGARGFGTNDAPTIENDVHIGAGAKVLGKIRVGQYAVIGANAVVTRDVPAGATVVGANRILPKTSQ